MSSNTKAFEDKMKSAVEHLERELKTVRAGRANPGVLDKVTVDYYGSPTPIQQVASVAVSEARTLTITPWDRTLLRAISKAILASDVGINPKTVSCSSLALCRLPADLVPYLAANPCRDLCSVPLPENW